MAHNKGSFDYKVIEDPIKRILDARSVLNNTVQVAMPFVKATTTIQHELLGKGSIGFTLGLHAINEDVKYEDIYANQSGNSPLIGYTYDADGNNTRVYAPDPNEETAQLVSNVFERQARLFSNSGNFIRMPPPGITQATVGRNKNGLIASAQLEISVPSLIQLEALHKLFFVPGLGMVLEWGQQFAVESSVTNVTDELPDISYGMFPWHDRARLLDTLDLLAQNKIGLPDILEKYVYPTSGQYMWMFGRVANFNIKSNSDGSFNCTVKIVGPSEDAWAYSTVNTVVAAKDPSAPLMCADTANSVYSYFTETATGLNLKSLLDDTIQSGPWQKHVIKFTQGNRKEGEPGQNDKNPIINNKTFADSDDAYFMSWRFFVNVVLNSERVGLKKIFEKASLLPSERNKISTLLPYLTAGTREASSETPGPLYINDPFESFVGMNNYLRSIDPSVLIIVNETAAVLAAQNPQYNIESSTSNFLTETTEVQKFKSMGMFDKGVANAPNQEIRYLDNLSKPDKGFLSSGVWINHKAVVEAMAGSDTILHGIVNLLERMNQATLNYWQLTIDACESDKDSVHPHNYMVVDANFRDSAEQAVSKFLDKVHVFNKYIRVGNTGSISGQLVGSELIDCSVDLSLPKRLFSQIATMGLVQPEDLQQVGISTGSISDPVDYTNVKSPKLSDPNDTLRQMFAITVLTPTSDSAQGPDLTILPKVERKSLLAVNGTCGKANTQLTAQTAGNGNRTSNIVTEEIKNKNTDELKKLKESAEKQLASNNCKECEKCSSSTNTSSTSVESFPPDANLNASAAKFLVIEEGFPRGGKAYYDPPSQTNLVSIGYGHQIKDNEYAQGFIQAGDERIPIRGIRGIDTVMTRDQARKLLEIDVVQYINRARSPIGAAAWNKLSINQKVALTSYAYNIGSTNSLVRAGILNTIDQNDSGDAAAIIRDKGIRTAQGRVLQVLVNRRAKEAALFAKDPIGNSSSPSLVSTTNNDVCKKVYETVGGKSVCDNCEKQKEILRQSNVKVAENEKTDSAKEKVIREFPNLQVTFRYVEVFPEYMVSEIAHMADGNFANAFGASPGSLSIKADLTMPGINGLRVGQLFWIDRIPTFYKAFGAFQIMSIEDTVSLDGWKTKIHAQFNFLGKKWKEAMAKKLTKR
jgi:GH24 family phage-related lysozyme (muramidase)